MPPCVNFAMCWVIPISRNKRAFHTFGTKDGAATGKADGLLASCSYQLVAAATCLRAAPSIRYARLWPSVLFCGR